MTRPLVYSAVPTAFHHDGALDLASTSRAFEHALAGGVDAIFVNGTTGEFVAMSAQERRAVLGAAVRVAGPGCVIAHVGASSPYECALLARDAGELGVTRLSVLTPYFMPTGVDGVRRQVESVIAAAPDATVFLYVFPDRTGVTLPPHEVAALVDELDIAGVKISVAGTDFARDVVAQLTSPRTVLSGNDGLLPELLDVGVAGIVSGVSSALPRPFATLAGALDTGDPDTAHHAAESVRRIVPVLGPSIRALKHSLLLQGVIDGDACRVAIAPLDAASRSAVAEVSASPLPEPLTTL